MLRDERERACAQLHATASLFISARMEPKALTLLTLQAAPIPSAATTPFDVTSFGGILSHFQVASVREPSPAHLSGLMLRITQAEDETAADTGEEHALRRASSTRTSPGSPHPTE